VVTGVGALIHVYATSYMAKDPAYWRFFSFLNLFIFAMLLLVLGDNFVVMFFGWEGVGCAATCSSASGTATTRRPRQAPRRSSSIA